MMTREESIAFYKAHARRLFNISLRIVNDSAQAEEIMQDTILKYISRTPAALDSRSSVVAGSDAREVTGSDAREAAWLAKTCIRASIDALRKKKREAIFLDEYAHESGSEAAEYEDIPGTPASPGTFSAEAVCAAIDGLPDPYRLIVNLVLIEGLDYEEISGFTGEKEGTLRVRYSRARAMLADALKAARNGRQ